MTSLVRLGLSAAIVALSCLVACPQVATAAAAADSHDAHDDHGAGHGLGHAGASEDPGEVKTDLAIFTAIVFLLLVIILRKFAWGPIAAGLEKRE
ncbi:MAG: hypothetical protein J0M17_05300, partial [Planctomycetes bacterium]|nr:hypothetical protein [Planctomycetota bacterium]